ncbi:unnamed protein product [Hyaloperonospora brassicae]|uniref:VPS9 domain-containing protein n=1 Tax=Hyaloperonospora brassicae TaxID=162125 RepID=A0AAV0UWU4_HYABA|nr:unnamed protein product [Hyaloperonospora brassicae]
MTSHVAAAHLSPTAPRRRHKEQPSEATAPAVWTVSDWATHPVIESFYGHARHARASSFYDVMCSPLNATATTTLGESCYGYANVTDNNEKDSEDSCRLSGVAATSPHARRLLCGSFAYSCTTDTSEEAALSIGPESPADDRIAALHKSYSSSSCAMRSGSGFAQWNKMRRTMSLNGSPSLVPVPPDHHFTARRPGSTLMLEDLHDSDECRVSAASSLDCGGLVGLSSPPTSSRLRAKLQASLRDLNHHIALEHKRLHQAQRAGKKSRAKRPVAPVSSVVWGLLCGTRRTETSHADGLAPLTEKLGVAVSHRALNQLQRHRRHVRGILKIVMAHHPDLELTERQLDSFEVADVMLAADIKYIVLHQQYTLLVASAAQRRRALAEAKLCNGIDCFEKPQAKRLMLSKLLEAVSWYRLMQRNAREKSALSSVGTVSASESASSAALDGAGPQERQVEKMLSVLSDEDFYSDFSKLMCQPDWWEVAQAHFENLIFSSRQSRICLWVLQLSQDVAAVSFEELEENESGGLRSHTSLLAERGAHRRPQHASWTNDTPPERIIDFVNRLTGRVRREFDVPLDVSKSLSVFIQRTVFLRCAVLCYDQKATRECQQKDKLWRKRCAELSGLPMENLGVSPDLVAKICCNLPSRHIDRSSHGHDPSQERVFFVRAIEAFNGMMSVVPCDLLDELMHGVVILHHEAALVLGTTQFSVETFFPLLAYVLIHCRLLTIHAQLHVLENFAITADNANGEESYYVYCVHAAVEYICNTTGLGVNATSAGARGLSTTSSTLLTPGMTEMKPALLMHNSSPRRSYGAFSSDLEVEGKASRPPPSAK